MRARFRTKSVGKTYPETEIYPLLFHSAAKEGEAETGGAEGQEALFQRAADDAAVQRQRGSSSNCDGDVVYGGGGDGADRNRFVTASSHCHFFITLRFCHI